MMAVLRVIWEQPETYLLAFVVQPDKNMIAILPKVRFLGMNIVILLIYGIF